MIEKWYMYCNTSYGYKLLHLRWDPLYIKSPHSIMFLRYNVKKLKKFNIQLMMEVFYFTILSRREFSFTLILLIT